MDVTKVRLKSCHISVIRKHVVSFTTRSDFKLPVIKYFKFKQCLVVHKAHENSDNSLLTCMNKTHIPHTVALQL